ncbi:MAG: NUDIX domain-containing protein [Magnetococcales bacterium]|nr:NUDIX domain-containing protein [Magnetococcales bacterium]MBF0321980.1 NUDIX domain-containing protein [Magnetococcales bacterium]
MKVKILDTRDAYHGYFRLQQIRLQYERFDGTMSRDVVLEAMRRPNAVAVLLYDPLADVVGMISQFRLGPFLNETKGWWLEVVAGLMDGADADPEVAARRETREETGIDLISLYPITRFYLAPNSSTEAIHLFMGVFNSHTPPVGGGGLAQENEDIRLYLLPYATVEEQLHAGKINNATSVVAIQWLQMHRERLRKQSTSLGMVLAPQKKE